MADLLEFLARESREPFEWGQRDCCTWACLWPLEARGIDPSASLRGTYSTARGALRHIKAAGSLYKLAAPLVDATGLVRVLPGQVYKPGDLGIIRDGQERAMAVRTPIGWACKSPHGITVVPRDRCVAAWRV